LQDSSELDEEEEKPLSPSTVCPCKEDKDLGRGSNINHGGFLPPRGALGQPGQSTNPLSGHN